MDFPSQQLSNLVLALKNLEKKDTAPQSTPYTILRNKDLGKQNGFPLQVSTVHNKTFFVPLELHLKE